MSIRNIDKGYYKQPTETLTLNFTGAITKDVGAIFMETNGLVTVEIPEFSDVTVNQSVIKCDIPERYRPSFTIPVSYPITVINNELKTTGFLLIHPLIFAITTDYESVSPFASGKFAGTPHRINFSYFK